jgi:hypothetical protein
VEIRRKKIEGRKNGEGSTQVEPPKITSISEIRY